MRARVRDSVVEGEGVSLLQMILGEERMGVDEPAFAWMIPGAGVVEHM